MRHASNGDNWTNSDWATISNLYMRSYVDIYTRGAHWFTRCAPHFRYSWIKKRIWFHQTNWYVINITSDPMHRKPNQTENIYLSHKGEVSDGNGDWRVICSVQTANHPSKSNKMDKVQYSLAPAFTSNWFILLTSSSWSKIPLTFSVLFFSSFFFSLFCYRSLTGDNCSLDESRQNTLHTLLNARPSITMLTTHTLNIQIVQWARSDQIQQPEQ